MNWLSRDAELLDVDPSGERSVNHIQPGPIEVRQRRNVLQSARDGHREFQSTCQTEHVESSVGRILCRVICPDDDLFLAVSVYIAHDRWRWHVRIKILWPARMIHQLDPVPISKSDFERMRKT